MNKNNIREYCLQKRRFYLNNNLVNLELSSSSVCKHFINFFHSNYLQLTSYKKSNSPLTIALYFPLLYEINILNIMPFFTDMNTRVCLPCIVKDSKILKFAYYKVEDTLESNIFNTQEPYVKDFCLPNIVVAPLLAFDEKHNRLGYGKGYYDNTINYYSAMEHHVFYIGVGYYFQYYHSLKAEKHDVPVDAIILDSGCL